MRCYIPPGHFTGKAAKRPQKSHDVLEQELGRVLLVGGAAVSSSEGHSDTGVVDLFLLAQPKH